METKYYSLYVFTGSLCCVRTIVVWKRSPLYLYSIRKWIRCVRTIVVWKLPIGIQYF